MPPIYGQFRNVTSLVIRPKIPNGVNNEFLLHFYDATE